MQEISRPFGEWDFGSDEESDDEMEEASGDAVMGGDVGSVDLEDERLTDKQFRDGVSAQVASAESRLTSSTGQEAEQRAPVLLPPSQPPNQARRVARTQVQGCW